MGLASMGQNAGPVFSLGFRTEFADGEVEEVFEAYHSGWDVGLVENPEVRADPGPEVHVGVGDAGSLPGMPMV